MTRWLPFALLFLALFGVVAYGLFRPAAEPSREPADVQQRLDAVPRAIGDWVNKTDDPLTEKTVNVGRFQAYLNRAYTQPRTGVAVSVMVLYGEPGDIGAHDPKVCYAGSGWTLDGVPGKERVGEADGGSGATAELWSARFRRREDSLRVYWGWGANGDWRAADNPRFTFARHRRIYKVYAQRVTPDTAPPSTADPLAEFVPKFLGCVNDAVSPPTR
jgi:hypothetical protein